MILNKIKQMEKERGFTIVELLIVIVIIAILAAITIVAYNGIQARANLSATQSAANTLMKKVEAYNAIKSEYPKVTTTFVSDMATDSTSTLTGTGITIGALTSAPTSKSQVKVELCGTGAGVKISYWDYTLATPAVTTSTANANGNKSLELGTVSGTCTVVTA